MAAASRQVHIPFCHEAGYDAMTIGDLFYTGFEKRSLVGSFQYDVRLSARFVDPGSGFSMKSFKRNPELFQQIKKIIEVSTLHRRTKDGIAEHARC